MTDAHVAIQSPDGRTPNIAMAHVLREVDVAVFPNRCEGDTAFVLDRQDPMHFPEADITGWGESDVEGIVRHPEQVWTDRQTARSIAGQGANFMAAMTWEHQTNRLMRAILPLLP